MKKIESANKQINLNDIGKRLIRRSDTSTILATIILFLVFAFGNPSFLTGVNIFNLSRTSALYMFIGVGQAFCLLMGSIDLSIGAVGGICVVSFGHMVQNMGLHPLVATVITLIIGIICGAFNGIIIVKLKLASFVVTLATSYIFNGIVMGLTKGYPYTDIPGWFTVLGRGSIGVVSYLFIVMVVMIFILYYFFKYMITGRQILATGGNETAARMSGIKTKNITLLCHTLSGFFAALAGILWISRLGSSSPMTGQDWMMISVAGAVLGGVTAGVFSSAGLFFAAVLFTMIKNGLVMLGVDVYFEQCFLGGLILFAICFEVFRSRFVSRKRL